MSGDGAAEPRRIVRVTAAGAETLDDAVAVERPLEIRIGGRALVVTLRTPGDDEELVRGFLANEGLVATRDGIAAMAPAAAACAGAPDVLDVTLAPGVGLDWTRLERHFASTSACGLCGRAHLDSLRAGLARVPDAPPLALARVLTLPARLAAAQPGFGATGALHAAAWCDAALEPVVVREDVGRHNAVDKVAGALLVRGARPAGAGALWVSGRAGAEVVLKAVRAGMPALFAVGAPTTEAIDLAAGSGMLLGGFLRDGRLNVYCGAERFVG